MNKRRKESPMLWMQPHTGEKSREEKRPVQPAPEGVGPLLQRDYVGVIEGSRLAPEAVVDLVRNDFAHFAPDLLAKFSRPDEKPNPLALGDTMHVFIPGVGHGGVVVAHLDDLRLTLRTLEGHFEAGTITFGADADPAGRVVFRIRSRSTINNPLRLLMYLTVGIHMQTHIWVTFVERVAEAAGGRVLGRVLVSTDRVHERPIDRGEVDAPTFHVARET
jgi:hypothetical protein